MPSFFRQNPLIYAVRFTVLFKYLGLLLCVYGVLMALPFFVALFYNEHAMAWRVGVTMLFLIGVGWPLNKFLKEPEQLQTSEVMLVVSLIFILVSLVSTFPFTGANFSFMKALFESTSGITTTGLSIIANPEDMPRSILFFRTWLQWVGGLGFVILCVGLFVESSSVAHKLTESEGAIERFITTARDHARQVLVIYVVATLGGWLLVAAFSQNLFISLDFVMSAISTGGFAPTSKNLMELTSLPARGLIIAASLMGALSFPLWYRLSKGRWHDLFADQEMRWLIGLSFLAGGFLFVIFWGVSGKETLSSLGHSLVLAVSAQTATGFTTFQPEKLESAQQFVLIGSMLVGGSVGSTAGGIKIIRFLVILKVIALILRRASLPKHAVTSMKSSKGRIKEPEIVRSLAVFAGFHMAVFLSCIPFLLYGYNPLDTLFEVASALGTAGLSTGITSSNLPALLKSILCIDMLLGRVEIIALLMVFYPSTWFGKRKEIQ